MSPWTVVIAAVCCAQIAPKPDIEFVPTSAPAIDAMLKLANVRSTDVVYDLGCGDGRILIAAAKRYGARGVGVDINPALLATARENAKKAGVAHLVRFEQGDLFKADIRDAMVVTLYLLTSINIRLQPKLRGELRPGARIVSNTFDMGGSWRPSQTLHVGPAGASDPFLNPTLFLWIVPER